MSTVSRLLIARGGFSRLGLNGFLARLLVFIDTNSAALLGTQPYLQGSLVNEPLLSGVSGTVAMGEVDRAQDRQSLNLVRFIGVMDQTPGNSGR
jgi:hypothetical protein